MTTQAQPIEHEQPIADVGGQLIRDLWWFIENVDDDTPDRNDRFFALRARVREYYAREDRERDKTPTRVIFRTYTGRDGGDVVAILLDVAANLGNVVCYQRIGQHGEGHYFRIMADTRPSTPEEYAPLQRELTSIGYSLVLRKRRSIQSPANGATRHTYRKQPRISND